jgi:hypothetical protein
MRATLFALSVLMPCVCAGADAEPIGRLFSTPAERADLDRLRQHGEQNKPASDQAVTVIPAIPVEPVREQLTLDGFVRRSSGKGTTWINQIPQNEGKVSQNIRVRQQLSKPPAVSILLPSGKRLDLKVGQTFDHITGKIVEVYQTIPVPALPKPIK